MLRELKKDDWLSMLEISEDKIPRILILRGTRNLKTQYAYHKALFAEGSREVDDWFQKGFAAVDMETAATFATAAYFGMDRMSILYTFDNPRRQEHIMMRDAAKDNRRQLGNTRMLDLVFDVIRKYTKA